VFSARVGVNPLFLLGNDLIRVRIRRLETPEDGVVESSELVRQAWAELEPELAEQGFELVEVEYALHGGTAVLRLFIDKDGGINIDDCASASRFVSLLLDKNDFIRDQYTLEVSSPGIDRPLRKPVDFDRYKGEKVAIKTVTPVEGRRRFKGVLSGYDDGLISFDDGGVARSIHIENVKKAKLDR